jgi:chaperone modulatory protein CbpM
MTSDIITGVVVEELTLSLEDLCRACHVEHRQIIALVEAGILNPSGHSSTQWHFSGISLQRARTALRLQRDLEVNLAGAALALDLLDEIQALRSRIKQY